MAVIPTTRSEDFVIPAISFQPTAISRTDRDNGSPLMMTNCRCLCLAHDPKTGGLVGINRGKHLLVFAHP